LLTTKEVIKITNEKTNGHRKEYDPEVEYRHLDVDVWGKKQKGEKRESVSYSDEIRKELEGNSDEDNSENPDN